MLPHSLLQTKAQKIPLQWKGARLCWTGGQVVLGKELNAGEKVKRWEKELNTAKGGGSKRASEQASRQQWSRGSNGQLHQGLPQTCETWEMCKTCKIAKHVKLAQSCGSFQVGIFGLKWIRLKWGQGSIFLLCIELLLIVRCWNRHKSPTKKIVSWPPFPSLASDPR